MSRKLLANSFVWDFVSRGRLEKGEKSKCNMICKQPICMIDDLMTRNMKGNANKKSFDCIN